MWGRDDTYLQESMGFFKVEKIQSTLRFKNSIILST